MFAVVLIDHTGPYQTLPEFTGHYGTLLDDTRPNWAIQDHTGYTGSYTELKKVGSMGSTPPEHSRFSPGTHKARNYLKDVWIMFQAICSVKIARFINISPIVPVA